MDQLKKEYEWYKEGCELEGIEFNDTFEEFVLWKEESDRKARQKRSDNIERHNWLYSVNG